METSAKTGHNVKSLFTKIAQSLPGAELGPVDQGTTHCKPSSIYLQPHTLFNLCFFSGGCTVESL